MRTAAWVLIWSLSAASATALAQHEPAKQEAKGEKADKKDASTAAKPTETKDSKEAKPATSPAKATSATAASAADRILKRLNEEFPIQKPGPAAPARPSAPRPTGTSAAEKSSKRVTLSWKLSLVWPEEIAPRRVVK